MEVRINKEVRDYQESLFFGLSLRQFLFALLAVAVAVGVYFGIYNCQIPHLNRIDRTAGCRCSKLNIAKNPMIIIFCSHV